MYAKGVGFSILLFEVCGALAPTSQPKHESSRQTDVSTDLAPVLSRRSLIGGTIGAGCLSILPSGSLAASQSVVVTSLATCDPTITVWKRNNRLIYLLGTAHISQVSADLAGQLVKDVHPNAVFVELDLKRVAGVAVPPGTPKTSSVAIDVSNDVSNDVSSADQKQSKIVVPVVDASQGAALSSKYTASSETEQGSPPAPVVGQSPQGGIGKKLLGFGAAAIGNAIKGMYKGLGDSGFNPGDEFIQAALEGKKQGADIVLGDQDVEITMNRLTQALAQTDLNKLLDPDSELERGMKELMGEEPSASSNDPEAYKANLSSYVENMKTRDSVTKIMNNLKEAAPALVQVMLTERDAYMSAGLDTLNQYEVITAVMGIAHVDGVERNLASQGWNQVRPTCRVP